MAALRLFCFGRLELLDADKVLTLPPTQKSQALLAYLVLHRGQPSSREHLMTLFWGERPAKRARRSLSTALWHIRRCQPDRNLLLADNQSVQFQAKIWLDVDAFASHGAADDLASLETAAALYRGPFLDDFFDEWVIDRRYQLQNDYLSVLSRLVKLYEEGGQQQQALAMALVILGEDPLRETAHRAAMRAFARLGQRNAALAHYQRCRSTIRDELGVEPMPETTRLAEQIRHGLFPAEPVSFEPATVSPKASRPAAAYKLGPDLPFVGRAQEMAFLDQWWEAGKGRLLFIEGEAGVGKTRLTHEFGKRIPGNLMLGGRCYEFERMLPYQPFIEALRPLALSLSAADWAQLPPWAVAEIARLLPELEEKLPDWTAAGLKPDRTRLFSAVGRLLSALAAQRPLLLVVEDLHWATESSLQLLHYLARQLLHQAVFLIGTFRQEHVGPEHPLRFAQRQLERDGLAQTLTLARLSGTTVEALVAKLVGSDEPVAKLARRLYQETDGNPFFLTETIQALLEKGEGGEPDTSWTDDLLARELPLPASVRAAILSRVQRLPEPAQEPLRLAAVMGREFDFDLLQTLSKRDEEQILEILELWLRARLVAEGSGSLGRDYVFTHHKIQEVLYEAEPAKRRQYNHARVAAAMEALYEAESVAGELAYHYLLAREFDSSLTGKAVHYLHLAGERAMAQYAHEEASAFFSQALSLTPESDLGSYALLLAQEQALDYLGSREAQAEVLAALEKLSQTASPESELTAEQKTTIALRRTNYGIVTGDYQAALAAACLAVDFAPTDDLLAEARAEWGLALFHQGDYEPAAAQLQQALPLARSAALPRTEAKILTVMGLVCWQQSQYRQAEARFTEALQICRRPNENNPAGEANALGNLGIIHRYQGDYIRAKAYFEQALAIWQAIGHRRGEGLYLLNLGVVAMDTGDVSGALGYCEQALAISREIADRHIEQTALNNLGDVYHHRGDFREAIAAAEQALKICREIGDRHGEGITYLNLGEATNGLGELAKARAYYRQALLIRREHGDRRGEALALIGLGDVNEQEGDLVAAAELLEQAQAICHEIGSAVEEGLALHGLAQLALDRGDGAAAAAYLEDGERISRDLHQPLLEGKLLIGWASQTRYQGQYDLSLEYGRQAVDLAQTIDARAMEGDAWFACGRALEALGRRDEAAAAYQRTLTIRRAIPQEHRLAEPLAGLSRLSS